MKLPALEKSRALWNRASLDLRSDEILAQIMDRGEMAAWRELYQLARADIELRRRIARIVREVPLGLPHFWMAALASLGEAVDFDIPVPSQWENGI
jgi:hypothetical protein